MKADEIRRSPLGVPRSAETLFNISQFAGNGYILTASDYIGNGISQARQAYAVKGATVATTLDMLQASRAVIRDLGKTPTKLFLNGWSQGGLNTLWLGNSLQRRGIKVEKQAVSSGPGDIQKAISYWFNNYPGNPIWLTSLMPLLLGSYQDYYKMDGLMERAIPSKYLPSSLQIYNKQVDWDKITGPEQPGEGYLGLPLKPVDMLTSRFVERFNQKCGAFYKQVMANTALEGKTKHPSRLYGGSDDTIVPPTLSIDDTLNYQISLGSSHTRGINVGPEATHRSTFLGSLYGSRETPSNNMLDWFNA